MNFKNLSGRKYGRLTVLQRVDNIGIHAAWLCKCDCGNTKIIKSGKLPEVKSCGCLRREIAGNRFRKHSMFGSRPYVIWSGMIARCNNVKNKDYCRYGGRGIRVCKRWLNFEDFWLDMCDGYSDALTIERINNDGNYEFRNCRWAERREQYRNMRRTVLIDTPSGKMMLAEAGRKYGVLPITLRRRIHDGVPKERVFTQTTYAKNKSELASGF